MGSASILRLLRRVGARLWASLPRRAGGSSRGLLPDLIVAPLVIVGLWLCVGVDLQQRKQAAVASAGHETAGLAVAASATVGQSIAMVDQTLLSLRADYAAAQGAGFDLVQWSRTRFGAVPAFRLDLLDPDGRPIRSNLTRPPAASWSPRLAGGSDRLIIGTVDAANDRLSLRFGRRLIGAGGAVLGMAVLSVDPRWLSHVYGALDDDRGFFLLAGEDGTVLARAPAEVLAIGAKLAADVSVEAADVDAATPSTLRGDDGIDRIVVFRRLPAYGLLLAVGQDIDRALAAYRAMRADPSADRLPAQPVRAPRRVPAAAPQGAAAGIAAGAPCGGREHQPGDRAERCRGPDFAGQPSRRRAVPAAGRDAGVQFRARRGGDGARASWCGRDRAGGADAGAAGRRFGADADGHHRAAPRGGQTPAVWLITTPSPASPTVTSCRTKWLPRWRSAIAAGRQWR